MVSTYKPDTTAFYIQNLLILRDHIAAQPAETLDLAQFKLNNPGCGTHYCIAGWLPVMPHFQGLGVEAKVYGGAPHIPKEEGCEGDTDETLDYLFGCINSGSHCFAGAYQHLCASRHMGEWDDEILELQPDLNDKDLALARIDKALNYWRNENEKANG